MTLIATNIVPGPADAREHRCQTETLALHYTREILAVDNCLMLYLFLRKSICELVYVIPGFRPCNLSYACRLPTRGSTPCYPNVPHELN